jgi:hypothetical protein
VPLHLGKVNGDELQVTVWAVNSQFAGPQAALYILTVPSFALLSLTTTTSNNTAELKFLILSTHTSTSTSCGGMFLFEYRAAGPTTTTLEFLPVDLFGNNFTNNTFTIVVNLRDREHQIEARMLNRKCSLLNGGVRTYLIPAATTATTLLANSAHITCKSTTTPSPVSEHAETSQTSLAPAKPSNKAQPSNVPILLVIIFLPTFFCVNNKLVRKF